MMPNLKTQVLGSAIAFIDRLVTDYQSLIAGVTPGTEVVVLDGNRDAIDQITEVLGDRTNIDSIHIVSHGAPGSLQLGKTRLCADNLESYAEKLQQWRSALTPRAEILIYGCNVASGPDDYLKVRRGINSPSHSASRLKPTENKVGIQSSLERSTGGARPLWVKETVKRSPKVVSDRIYYPCVPIVRPTSQWCLEEPDLERGCGHDDYDIGEGVIPYPV
ncbi:MAG: DUF4347 domain-containing protein [Microcoleus sp.]